MKNFAEESDFNFNINNKSGFLIQNHIFDFRKKFI